MEKFISNPSNEEFVLNLINDLKKVNLTKLVYANFSNKKIFFQKESDRFTSIINSSAASSALYQSIKKTLNY